ncbi:HNH endonuclease signature motif containing protein, partial [Leifsonella bigeumensis]|uniref:HNH endonuclease signature motif containing protein n=1 Tax=Leifsonella bigeumensis TaxID=433643 RepID=UPI0031DFFC23
CQAITRGTLSIDSADALRRGLGKPTETIAGEMLSDVAERLIREKSDLSADRLYKAARVERELIDLDGIQARQQELYDRGGLKLFPQPDGMWRLSGQVDPESAAILTTALDPYTSPRRGGPRFTRPDDIARAKAIIDDPRTTERLTLDGLLELVKLGAGVDPQKMQPKLRTLVKIVTTVDTACSDTADDADDADDAADGAGDAESAGGFGVIEGNGEVVSAATIQRILCDGDAIELTLDRNGTPLDLGRTSRLYDRRQREALAVRDGGCLWPGCDRPPAFTEAHHTKQWKRDRGRTDVDDGVLLCRFHHLQLHNNHWEIERRGSAFWLIPPPTVDPAQAPILLQTKSTLIEHLRRSAAG